MDQKPFIFKLIGRLYLSRLAVVIRPDFGAASVTPAIRPPAYEPTCLIRSAPGERASRFGRCGEPARVDEPATSIDRSRRRRPPLPRRRRGSAPFRPGRRPRLGSALRRTSASLAVGRCFRARGLLGGALAFAGAHASARRRAAGGGIGVSISCCQSNGIARDSAPRAPAGRAVIERLASDPDVRRRAEPVEQRADATCRGRWSSAERGRSARSRACPART